MDSILKRIKTNAMLSAALYAFFGLVLLIWPEITATVLCNALGLILLLCGIVDIFAFLRHRDGTLYSAMRLVVGVILSAVGIWLMTQHTLVSVIIPRIIGVLICIHGISDTTDAVRLYKKGASYWKPALLLAFITLALGALLVFNPFSVYQTAIRIVGVCLLYDGISDLWIAIQLSRADRPQIAEGTTIDAEYRDTKEDFF